MGRKFCGWLCLASAFFVLRSLAGPALIGGGGSLTAGCPTNAVAANRHAQDGRPEFDCSFPGGNVKVLGYDANSGVATIDSDFRDSTTDWFWTYFRVRGAAGRKIHFKFSPRRPNRRQRLSRTGMAYSTDEGKSWRWTAPDGRHADPFSFDFEFPPDAGSVRFATSIPYLRSNLDEFCAAHPGIRLSTLTRSRKGRDVPLLSVGSGETAKWSFMFTARHHASEVTASWVMEGMAEAASADTQIGRWLRENVHCLFVPFMDTDGCEDGDPGKNRAPHDHNRDYRARIYPEVRAFQDLVREETRRRKIVYFDMHAPQVRGSDIYPRHDNVFTMGPPPAMEKFWNDYRRRLVEATSSNALKFFGRWDEPWMTDFNVPAKKPGEQKSHDWVLEQTNVLWTATFEFGYGLCGGVVSREGLRELGRTMMEVLARGVATPAPMLLEANTVRLELPATGDVTAEIQAAIDRLSAAGGGTVVVPAGFHDVHGVMLKDDVTLRLEKGCVLNGATNSSPYTTFKMMAPDAKETLIVPWALEGLANIRAVVGAVRARNVSLEGEGTIDGRGHLAADFSESDTRKAWSWRDVCFFQCTNVRVTGLELRNAASWTCYFKECDGVYAARLRVHAHVGRKNDGIDIDSRNVIIDDCDVDSDDDGICLKSSSYGFLPENIEVRNCRIGSNCNALKLGTACRAGFRNVRFIDCKVVPSSGAVFYESFGKGSPGVTEKNTCLSGIAVESPDGGIVEDILFSGIDMTAGNVQTPVFLRLQRRNERPDRQLGAMRDIVIENIKAVNASHFPCAVVGVPGLRIKNVTFRNFEFRAKGGCTRAAASLPVPEVEDKYPDIHMFDRHPLPAYGFYLRHADCITFDKVRASSMSAAEERPALAADDVTGIVRTASPSLL